MSQRTNHRRRDFVKLAGASVVGTSLAGCLGGQDGDGGDGDGGGGATTQMSEPEVVRMILSPFGMTGIIYDQMLNATNRLEDRLNDAGYTVEAKESWENVALFASGGPDFGDMGPIEAATLGSERDLKLATNGRMVSFFPSWLVKNGGPYDTDNTGSVEASVQKIADEGKFAIGSWGGGDVQVYPAIMQDRFGLDFAEEGGDFEIVTADYFALPSLAADGEVAGISTAPQYGAAAMFASDEPVLEELFWTADLMRDMGFGTGILNSWVTTQEFANENPEAVEAVVGAWEDTVTDFNSRPYELATQQKYMEMMAAETEEQARWLVDWGVKNEYTYETPVLFEDSTLTQDRIEGERKLIDRSAELGFISSDWEDHLEFRTVDP